MFSVSPSLRSWREWVRARNFLWRTANSLAGEARQEIVAQSSRDLRGFLHSRSGQKFARVPTPAVYAGYVSPDLKSTLFKQMET